MKKLAILLLALVASSTAAFSQENKGLLYEILGNGLSKPSYLFGTFHIMCPQDYDLNETVKSKLKSTNQTVLELDMDDPQMMVQMQQTMFMTDGKSLKDLLPEVDYNLVKAYFIDSLNMPFGLLEKVKPFALSSMLYPKILGCPMQSYEMDLVKLSKENKSEVMGLESVADQMGVFDKIPYEKQAEDLLKAVSDLEKSRTEFNKMIAAYKTKDIDVIAKMVAEEENGYADFTDVLLTDRNKNWIAKMVDYATAKSTFFAVGAGHLGGDEGVVNLLRKKGFTVRPVTE